MLRAAQAYALRTEAHRVRRVRRRICIGPYLESPVLVRPVHDALEIA